MSIVLRGKKYPFKTSTGSEIIPVADGTFTTDTMMEDMASCEVYFEFYNDEAGATPVEPNAGTIVTSGSPLGGNYLAPSANATTQASACGPEATYTPPVLDGLTNRARIVLNGITGATHMRAVAFKH